MPRKFLNLYGLDTSNGRIEQHGFPMEVESVNDDNLYEVALEWASEDLGCEVYSFDTYTWTDEHTVEITALDSEGTQGYTPMPLTLSFNHEPTDEEIQTRLEAKFGKVHQFYI